MKNYKEIVDLYKSRQYELKKFSEAVVAEFQDPNLLYNSHLVVHSIKSRLKDPKHLVEKIKRKYRSKINKRNLFKKITDLAGVRILHLYQNQFPIIHNKIMCKIEQGDWKLFEDPIAYTWDPDAIAFYEKLGIKTTIKDSSYTSIHYVVKPNNSDDVCCEIQVRTLFEEIWGEIDHTINYPNETNCVACREELKVLAKLISTGTRLADSIFNNHALNSSIEKKRKKKCKKSI